MKKKRKNVLLKTMWKTWNVLKLLTFAILKVKILFKYCCYHKNFCCMLFNRWIFTYIQYKIYGNEWKHPSICTLQVAIFLVFLTFWYLQSAFTFILHLLFHGSGLSYELGICIRTGYIVWACGGLPCGEWSDLRLARHAFFLVLQEGEKAIDDRGCRDQNYF